MILLSATGIEKYYGTVPILTDISFHISKGDRVGIVGDNGAGKSTLLGLLTGELSRDSGEFYMAQDTTVGYLKQKDNFISENTVYGEMLAIFEPLIRMEKDLERLYQEIADKSAAGQDVSDLLDRYDAMTEEFRSRDGYSFRSEIVGILSSMAFPESFYDKKISSLSGGERTRLALAALLLRKPDLLLLDEPTNHLDIGTLKWLEQYLKNYTGTLVVVSHDRYFLDQTVNRIFEIQNCKLTSYEGNYSTFVEKKKFAYEDAERRYQKQQEEIRRQEDMIRRFKERGTEKLANRAKSREKQLAHIERLERPEGDNAKMRLQFKENFASGNDVLFAEGLSKSFKDSQGTRQLFRNVNLDIKRGERVCIVGQNGIGKSTLLKILVKELLQDSGTFKLGHNVEIAYYDQDQLLVSGNSTVLEELHSSWRLYTEGQLRSILGRFLFRGEDVFKPVAGLSGGEKARLSLVKIMLMGANFLIMDEPTNHLDIRSKEVFEDALKDFPGTLLVVSHDRYFLNKIPTRIVELTQDGMENYLGAYDYYLEKKQEAISSGKNYLGNLGKAAGAGSAAAAAADQKNQPGADGLTDKERRMEERRLNKERESQRRKLEKQKNAAEEEIAKLEEAIAALDVQMAEESASGDFVKLGKLHEESTAKKAELEAAYSRWEEAELALEEFQNTL
ncbi:MAG: ATP-binding cassette domain-containing protein [Clostridiales bacterium]|nr:ATP-binding cassette domain-containing protein [Clostridiales bacterium]